MQSFKLDVNGFHCPMYWYSLYKKDTKEQHNTTLQTVEFPEELRLVEAV